MSRQSFRSVLKLALAMIGLATMTHAASAGPHKDGCAACDIQMLGVVARWHANRLQDTFRRLALSPGPPPNPLSDTDAGLPVNPDRPSIPG
jgi:hypothetical protein